MTHINQTGEGREQRIKKKKPPPEKGMTYESTDGKNNRDQWDRGWSY